jgi:hypothetical protein
MSVLSHIVSQRLAGEVENVATEALTFILNGSEGARRGMVKVLRGVAPDLLDLEFATQSATDDGRPDMTGTDGQRTLVLVENKFWAGLTDQQPHAYLRHLAGTAGDAGVLLVVCPAARATSLWTELTRRLIEAGIPHTESPSPAGIERTAKTSIGPALALTTWPQLLIALELEAVNEPGALADIAQLRALCERTDQTAWKPLPAESITAQDTPALILQLGALADEVVRRGVGRGALNVKGLTVAYAADRIGRYVLLVNSQTGVWIGTHLSLWRDYGATPLWLVCNDTRWGQAPKFKALAQAWAHRTNKPFASRPLREAGGFAVGLHVPPKTEFDGAVEAVLSQVMGFAASMSDGGREARPSGLF